MPVSRDNSIDALRAFALFGILIVNLPFFAITFGFAGTNWLDHGSAPLNIAAAVLIRGGFENKFILLFSALFGYGAWYQLHNRGSAYYLRRLVMLALFGAVNLTLLFEADVLLPYAVIGLSLLALRRWTCLQLLALASTLWILAISGEALFGIRALLPQPSATTGSDTAFASIGEILRSGGFWDVAALRLSAWAEFRSYCFWGNDLAVAGAMVAGFAAGKYASDKEPDALSALLRQIAVILAVPAGIAGLGYGILVALPGDLFSLELLPLELAARPASSVPLFLVITGMMLTVFRTSRFQGLTQVLAPAGRLSLTIYLSMSLVMGLLFFGYGFGLHGRPSLTDTLWISLAIYLAFVGAAFAWEKSLGRGPLERIMGLAVRQSWFPATRVLSHEER